MGTLHSCEKEHLCPGEAIQQAIGNDDMKVEKDEENIIYNYRDYNLL